MKLKTLRHLLEDYILSRDHSGGTPDYYRRCVGVLEKWHGRKLKLSEFTVETCNRFLLAKKEAGRSSYYRKSLRSALRALLNHAGIEGKLRPVKFERLNPQVWTAAEVDRLAAAAPNQHWKIRVLMGYYTGLNQVDLELIEKRHIVDGVLRWRRSKTGKLVVVSVPAWLVAQLPDQGRICPRSTSLEWTRRQFREMLAAAGLTGTFKKLRKTSGTVAESLHPGAGHLHLGNTRAVFELHYMNPERGLVPLALTPLEVTA